MCAAGRVTFTTEPLNEMGHGQWVPLQFNASDFFKAGLEKAVREARENRGISGVCDLSIRNILMDF